MLMLRHILAILLTTDEVKLVITLYYRSTVVSTLAQRSEAWQSVHQTPKSGITLIIKKLLQFWWSEDTPRDL